MWIPHSSIAQSDELEELGHALSPIRLLVPPDPEPELDIALGRHVGKEAVRLEDHAHPALVGLDAGDVAAVDEHPARGRPVESGDDAERCRLAATGRAEERKELASLDREVDAVERNDLPEDAT